MLYQQNLCLAPWTGHSRRGWPSLFGPTGRENKAQGPRPKADCPGKKNAPSFLRP